jgi:hypothetical protein
MKKYIIALSIAALALTSAAPALAHSNGDNKGKNGFGNFFKFGHKIDNRLDASKFILTGTIASKTATSVSVTVQTSAHVANVTNNIATVNVASDTKITAEKNETITLANLNVGDQVSVGGSISGAALNATNIHVTYPVKKAFGKVTAKTATTVTLQNSITGTTQTVTVNPDTKISINGETKAITDVAVGDSGWVKFKVKTGVMIAKMVHLFR